MTAIRGSGEQARAPARRTVRGSGGPAPSPAPRTATGVPQPAQPAPPIKRATWEWYIPIYFWLGGISAGAWLIATAEDLTSTPDRKVIRAGRYLALTGVLTGTALLIADLGRPDRFHNMLRIFRARSAISLGSWGLTLYGNFTGLAALLQAAEDGLFGKQSRLARLSRGNLGRAVHVAGLPAALFVGGYAGVLLASTSTPSWARRTGLLGPLFLASAASSGAAAVAVALETTDARTARRPRRRLAAAETAALAAELALAVRGHAEHRRLASSRSEPFLMRLTRALMLGAGMALPLALSAAHGANGRPRRRRTRELLGPGLALAGSLALRYLVTSEGYRSAVTPEDTWQFTETGRETR